MIAEAKELAKRFLDETTYLHSERVASYTEENKMIPHELRERCIALAWLHDLWEDSSCGIEEILPLDPQKLLVTHMSYITHQAQEQNYTEYIQTIKNIQNLYPEVWWVKLADMKDHLSQQKTLTPRLKDKYTKALSVLL